MERKSKNTILGAGDVVEHKIVDGKEVVVLNRGLLLALGKISKIEPGKSEVKPFSSHEKILDE